MYTLNPKNLVTILRHFQDNTVGDHFLRFMSSEIFWINRRRVNEQKMKRNVGFIREKRDVLLNNGYQIHR